MSDKQSSPFLKAVKELGWEFLLTVISFGIGALILWACGMDLQTIMETDWAVILGCGVFVAVFIAVYALTSAIKNRKKSKNNNQTQEDEKIP